MEFMSRGSRPAQSHQPAGNPNSNVSPSGGAGNRPQKASGLLGLGTAILLFSIGILSLGVLGAIIFGKGPASEFKSVDTGKMQAVFLNGGQVYFGKVRSINPDFMRLTDIYYLRVDQPAPQPNQGNTQQQGTPILVKLGCELHRPTNEMVINREQIIFWENLQDDDSQNTVPGAVKKYIADNPDGQKCDQPQQQQQAAPTPAPAPTPATPPATNNQNRR